MSIVSAAIVLSKQMAESETTQWQESLRDGTTVLVRPLKETDLELHRAFVEGLSPQSRHYQFLGGVAHLHPKEWQRLCDLDYCNTMAYIAVVRDGDADREIGIARYARGQGEDDAEIAVTVADDWQRKGVATVLLRHLIEHARAQGVRRLYSIDAATNLPMCNLARSFGFTVRSDPHDRRHVIASLDLRNA